MHAASHSPPGTDPGNTTASSAHRPRNKALRDALLDDGQKLRPIRKPHSTPPTEGVKNYSNWPTIPQVYLNGEFVGGCDILLQMHQNGDLVEELKKLGIRSALLDEEKNQDKK